ncbi:helix-turn-helix domain-containing protein [Anaerosporobacter sp.]|uniref:helix-turn-helix domain-containing protein n=1 Tax=Anaerosporobacter sp. TaxID=1872529 RepID=UPI00286EE318|nr:helix-turn-helix transcriptional regulator [Anaerosporobacter sp.]
MQEKIAKLLEEYNMTFGDLAENLGISKQTLTKKVQGKLDWTYPEMEKLIKVFQIKDPQEFFF